MKSAPVLKPFEGVDYAIYAALAGFKMWLHFVVARHDGIFRDEYYYLACANHLNFGYVDQPPLSILVLALTRALFGDSVLAIRIPVILATGLIAVLLGLFTRRMGGGRFAQGFVMLCVLACPMMMGIHSYFSMNTFDHLFWLLAAYVLVAIIQTENAKLWLLFGLVCGLGLENKMSMLFFGFGVVAALLFTPQRKWFASPWLYAGGAIALLLFLPNLIWQAMYGFPTVEFMRNAALLKNAYMPPWEFLLQLVIEFNPLLAPVAVMGLLYPFRRAEARALRPLAIAFLAVLLVFTFGNGKTYYMAPAFLLVWPLGVIWIERLTEGTKLWRPALGYALFSAGLAMAPIALTFLPPADYVAYAAAVGIGPKPGEKSHSGLLPQHVADRLGWRARAELVKAAYESLSPEDKAKCVIWGSNYGEAGAMEYYAEELGLPSAITGHNNYWLWGPGDATGEVVILIDDPDSSAIDAFESVEDFGTVQDKSAAYQMDGWQANHVYIARGLKKPIAEVWQEVRFFI